MPREDGSGPQGRGPMTGRKAGRCNPDAPVQDTGQGRGQGKGKGRGQARGPRDGRGQGMGGGNRRR